MDPADEWMQAELESRATHPAPRTLAHHNQNNNNDHDDDDDDPFADFADDEDLLRALPCALDEAPLPASFPTAGPAMLPFAAHTGHASADPLAGETFPETHQSGFFSASFLDDEDWAAYGMTDAATTDVEALRVSDKTTTTTTTARSTAPAAVPATQPVGVFTSAIPSERPSFALCGDDGRRLWVTASGMERKRPARDPNGVPVTMASSSSAHLDDDKDDDDEDDEEEGHGAAAGGASLSPSLLGEVSVQELLHEARTALAEAALVKRTAAVAAAQQAELALDADDVLLAAALDEEDADEDEDADVDGSVSRLPRARVSRAAQARRAKRARESDAALGDAGHSSDGSAHAQRGRPHSQAVEDMLWVAKYTPRTFREALSDETINLELLRWLKSWDPFVFEPEPGRGLNAGSTAGPAQPPEERIAVLVGPPGVGKTTLAHVLAAHCGYEAIEINASVERTAARLEGTIQLAVGPAGGVRRRRPRADAAEDKATTLADHLLRPKCLIIDEMDGITSNVAQFLLRQDIRRPVFCLCNDFYVPSLRLMRQRCRHVFHLPPVQPQRLLARLEEICAREQLRVEQAALAELVQSSGGDIRSCLNTLQFLNGMPEVQPRDEASNKRSTATVAMVREVQGKDSKLDAWESWNVAFVKSDRNRTVQLLKKDCGIDYEALVMASTANQQSALALRKARERARVIGTSTSTVTPTAPTSSTTRAHAMMPIGFRVDPGYLFASHELPRCADWPLLLDGLQENYCQRPYTDYTLRRTAAAAAGFSNQDVLSTAAFARAPMLFAFAEDFQLVTALTCYTSCSTTSRGPRLQYPRLGAQLHRQIAESAQVTLALREGCHAVEIVNHLWSDESISTDLSILLLRSLVDASVRLPSHPINTLSALPPNERKLMEASVARHAMYGLGYRENTRNNNSGGGGGGSWDPETRERRPEWRLMPELDLLGGIRKPFSAPVGDGGGYRARTNRFGAPGHANGGGGGGGSGPGPSTSSASSSSAWATSSTTLAKRSAAVAPPSGPTLACRALTLREETKLLLQGEIHRYVVQRTADTLKAHQTAAVQRGERLRREARAEGLLNNTTTAADARSATAAGAASSPVIKATRTEMALSPSARDTTEQAAVSQRLGAIAAGEQATTAGRPGGTVKRDFFGRPIVPKTTTTTAASASAASAPASASPPAGGTSSPPPPKDGSASATRTGLAVVPIKYVYYDGCTNAVKMPATFADF